MCRPKLNMPATVTADEDTTDEVKVFTTDDADKELASQVLSDDKNDITFQADLEGRTTANDVPSTSALTNANGTIGSKSHTAFSKPSQHGPSSGGFESGINNGISANFLPNGVAFSSAAQNQLNGQLLLWNYAAHGALMGQPYALPFNAPPPLLFPRFPAAAPAAGGPPPAHSGGNLGALSLDPSATVKTGSPSFGSPYFPTPHGLSPSFADLYSPFVNTPFAPLARFSPMIQASSPANLSPIHSPASGTPIAPTQHLRPDTADLLSLKPRIATSVSLPSSLQFRMLGNPLASMAQLRLPAVTTTVTNLANTLSSGNMGMGKMHPNDQRHRLGSQNSNGESHLKKEPHIKKPLNAFMIFMKENRQKLMEEKGYKERQSAELNKELGRLWHTLTHEEQQKYYQIARDERQKHLQLYPGWSARDNYAVNKKKKRKRDKSIDNAEMKKCRARFGLDQQPRWCKHCRRKKKCLWFREGASGGEDSPEEQSPPAQVSSTTHGSPENPITQDSGPSVTKQARLDVSISNNNNRSSTIGDEPRACISSDPSNSPTSQQGLVSSTTSQRKRLSQVQDEDEDDGMATTDEEVSDDDEDVDSSIKVTDHRSTVPPAVVNGAQQPLSTVDVAATA